jgi:hypothetical protein
LFARDAQPEETGHRRNVRYGAAVTVSFATRAVCMTFQPRRHVTRTPIVSELK